MADFRLPQNGSLSSSTTWMFFNYGYHPAQNPTALLLGNIALAMAPHAAVEIVCGVGAFPSIATPSSREPRVHYLLRGDCKTNSFLSRFVRYASFLIRAGAFVCRCKTNVTVVSFTDPPFLEVVLGLICRWKKIKYFIVAQEIYPEMINGLPAPLPVIAQFISKRLSRAAYRGAEKVIAISNDSQTLLKGRGVLRVEVIPNWADPAAVQPQLFAECNVGPLVVHYGGNIGLACDLESFEEALGYLSKPEDFIFAFRGNGIKVERLRRLTERYPMVRLTDFVSMEKLNEALGNCHVHLVLTSPQLIGSVFSSKVYTAMAAARALIVSAPAKSEMHAFVKSVGAGWSCASERPAELALLFETVARYRREAPHELLRAGDAGRNYIESTGNPAHGVASYLRVFTTTGASGNSAPIPKNN